MYKCKAWTRYISKSAHVCGCDTKYTQTQTTTRSSPFSRSHSPGDWDHCETTNNLRERGTCFLSVSFFTQSSWRFGSWFALSEPPAGSLNRPLINPSVGSLLRPQPYEEGSNPAKQTERRLSSWRGGEEENKLESGRDFLCRFTESEWAKELISPHKLYKLKLICDYYVNCHFNLYCNNENLVSAPSIAII